MTDDAIVWRANAAHLLPLVPRTWIKTLLREHVESVAERRRTYPDSPWPCLVNMCSGGNGLNSISANGDIAFHTDESFPQFGHLLIIRPAGYVVSGQVNWRGAEQDFAGDVICFRQKTHFHALMVKGTTREDSDHLDPDIGEVVRERPGRLWMSLTLDTDDLLTPSEAIKLYESRLKVLPINRLNKNDVER